jgi:hypothetical protein
MTIELPGVASHGRTNHRGTRDFGTRGPYSAPVHAHPPHGPADKRTEEQPGHPQV